MHVGRYWIPNLTWEKAEPAKRSAEPTPAFDVQKEVERLLLTEYGRPGSCSNRRFGHYPIHRPHGQFSGARTGRASLNLAKLIRAPLPGHPQPHPCGQQDAPVIREGVRIKSNGRYRTITLEVVPIKGAGAGESYFLVLFREGAPDGHRKPALMEAKGARRKAEEAEVSRLTKELEYTRAHVQSIMEEQEASNEELRSANEEIQSSNEELQSTNEEMETAKEQVQVGLRLN